jgi:hypothetical protein
MNYVGTGAIGGIIGYYVGAQGLLGIQSEEVVRDPEEDEDQPSDDEDQTADSVLPLEATFEDGTIEPFVELNDSGWTATSSISQQGDYSIGVDNQSPADDDPDLRWSMPEQVRPNNVTFHFYEYEDQQSGSLFLLDKNDDIITGAGTSNPEWTIRDSPTEGGGTWNDRSEDGNYQRWIRMSLQINWEANTVSVTGEDLQTNTTESTEEQLLSTNPVSSIVIGSIRFRDSDYGGGNPKHMYFDNITVE